MNKIAPLLWMGSVPDPVGVYKGFDVLVLCASEVQPKMMNFQGKIIRAPFIDTLYPTDIERRIAIRAARSVAKSLKRGNKVLVTCAAGLNRSGLVAGLALRMASRRPTEEIIARIRRARGPMALSNPAFVRFLRGFSSRKGNGRATNRHQLSPKGQKNSPKT